MKKIWIFIALYFSHGYYLTAQITNTKRIDFVQGLTWMQIEEKAKAENRYIFLDAFTTWCMPCIKMDKEVFTQKKVRDFFNKNFINVKVQMDVAKKDTEPIKRWYQDAKYIAATYNVDSYPTYLFFNPQGELVKRITGFSGADEFIAAAAAAKGSYFSLKVRFDLGERDPNFLLELVKSAQLMNDRKFIPIVINEYLSTQKDLLSEENIKFLSIATIKVADLGFQILRAHPIEVDKVLGKGRSTQIVKTILFNEIALPYLRTDASVTSYGGGLVVYGGKLKDTVDWTGLKAKLDLQYPDLSKSVIITSKLHYYQSLPDWIKFTKTVSENEQRMDKNLLNSSALTIFSKCEDDYCIKQATAWSERLVSANDKNPEYLYAYSNLLYKSGRTKKAIKVFEDVIKLTGDPSGSLSVKIDKMKKGEKIW